MLSEPSKPLVRRKLSADELIEALKKCKMWQPARAEQNDVDQRTWGKGERSKSMAESQDHAATIECDVSHLQAALSGLSLLELEGFLDFLNSDLSSEFLRFIVSDDVTTLCASGSSQIAYVLGFSCNTEILRATLRAFEDRIGHDASLRTVTEPP